MRKSEGAKCLMQSCDSMRLLLTQLTTTFTSSGKLRGAIQQRVTGLKGMSLSRCPQPVNCAKPNLMPGNNQSPVAIYSKIIPSKVRYTLSVEPLSGNVGKPEWAALSNLCWLVLGINSNRLQSLSKRRFGTPNAEILRHCKGSKKNDLVVL